MTKLTTPVALPIPKPVHPVVTKWTANFELHLLPLGVGVTREWVSLFKEAAMKRRYMKEQPELLIGASHAFGL